MTKKYEGMISNQNIEPGKGISRGADQLLHDSARTSAKPLNDKQQELTDEWRITLRSPNGFKPQIVCDEGTALIIGKALQDFGWKIIERRPETLEREIDEATQALVENGGLWVILRFDSADGDITFRTDIGEKDLTALLQRKGWTLTSKE